MLRIPLLLILLPLRLLIYAYAKIRAMHKGLLLDLVIKSDFTEAPLAHGIWSYIKPAKDRFYLFALELAAALRATQLGLIKLKAVRVTIEAHSMGWAQAWEIRDLLQQFGAAGIQTSVYLLTDNRVSVFIASAAHKIYTAETATIDLSPFTHESLFVQSLFAKLGIRPQFMSVGEFKSAAEIFTRKNMSPAARKQTEALMADLEATFRGALRQKAPELGKGKETQLIGAHAAVAAGFIDKLLSFSEFTDLTEDETDLKAIDLYAVDRLIRRKTYRLLPLRRKKRIALIVAEGNIIESAESRPGTINWPDYQEVSEALREKKFSGAIVRVNSPGGSAFVSQLLWREWMLALGKLDPIVAEKTVKSKHKQHADQEKKKIPVFVSQGNVAASGGYYLSAVADKIFSTPMSITGSIGVVGGKFNVGPLLKKLGIDVDRAPKRNQSPPLSLFADFSPSQRKAIRDNMEEIYGQFLQDVAQGRKMPVERITPHASGRVFSGDRALRSGLADVIGGVSATLEAMRSELKLGARDTIELVILPIVKESLFNRSMLPFGLSYIASLADFTRPGVYTLDTRLLL